MKARINFLLAILLLVTFPAFSAEETAEKSASDVFAAAVEKFVSVLEPAKEAEPQTLSVRLELVKAEGLPKEVAGRSLQLAYQAPDRLLLSTKVGDRSYSAGRNGQQLWAYVPHKHFGVVGEPGQPRFVSAPDKKDNTRLPLFKLPVSKDQLALLPLLMDIKELPAETIGQTGCRVLDITPKPEAIDALKIPAGRVKLWVRTNDYLPARIGVRDGKKASIEVVLHDPKLSEPWPAEKWQIPSQDGDKVEKTALSHLTKFITVALATATQKIPTLGPATGERKVVATSGKGRLEMIDGTRVLFLAGTPQEMGQQHGTLMKRQVRDLVDHILYGVGVGSSFEKGRWFFNEIDEAQRRTAPFVDARYVEEMDAIAAAAGLQKEEVRLANFFPELFHCSGFAVFGQATLGGRMFHGRILDYLKGIGLEQNAAVIVFQPDRGNAWVNVSYAGFIGSVTAMNAKQVAIGEMGGRGEGNWDGKPMAQLVREVMENASTLDEAIAIMRKGPRTCEYYYVISDAKAKSAVGIAATPEKFEIVRPGEAHARLPEAIKDAVLMSAGDRYKKLVERVREKYGKIDEDGARDLMRRPVAMNSNIHSALFAPDTLDFWIANADSKNAASHARYTHYNLAELLKGPPPGSQVPGSTGK
jgi:hypothetical protein